MSLDELKKALKSGKLVYGTDKLLKNLKLGNVKVVFLSRDCKEEVRKEVKKYGVVIHELNLPSDEIALIAKKPYPISILSY